MFNWSTIIKISPSVRSEPVTRGIRAIPALPVDLAPSWNYAQEFEEDQRPTGQDRRFYRPMEFIKKIRCSQRQHLIRFVITTSDTTFFTTFVHLDPSSPFRGFVHFHDLFPNEYSFSFSSCDHALSFHGL